MKEYAYILDEGEFPAHLATVPFLDCFDEDQLEEVLNSASLLQCDVGDVIIAEGAVDSRFYILLEGSLLVKAANKNLAKIDKKGDVFGELALVNQGKRGASVIAEKSSVCLALDQKFLQDIHPRHEDPEFHAALFEFVAKLLAKKLADTSQRLVEAELEIKKLKQKKVK
jgi:CRP-like cAMP-binding protein